MRLASFAALVLALVGCSRQPPPPDPEPVLGAIVLPATDPKLGPHPDLKLSYEDFCRKHFPDEWREYVELTTKTAELDELAQATRRGPYDRERWDKARGYQSEATALTPRVRAAHEDLFRKVAGLKAEMKGRDR